MNKLSKTVILFIASLALFFLSFIFALYGNLFVFISFLVLCIINFVLFLISLITQLKDGNFILFNKKQNTKESNKFTKKTKLLLIFTILSLILFFISCVFAYRLQSILILLASALIVLIVNDSYRKSKRKDIYPELLENEVNKEKIEAKNKTIESSSNIDFIEDMIFNNDQTTGRSADTDFIENMILSKTNSSTSKNTSSTKSKSTPKKQPTTKPKQKGNVSKKNIQNIAKLIGFDFTEMQTVKIKNDKRYLLSGESQFKAKHDIMYLNKFIDKADTLAKGIHPNRIEKDNIHFSHNADALLDGTFCIVDKINATDDFNVLPMYLHFSSNKFYGDAKKSTEDKIAGSIYYSQEGNISHAVINQWYKDNLKVVWVTSSYNYIYIDKIEEFDEKHNLVAIYEYS